MKKLEISQMENLQGEGMNGRNCMLAGAGAALGIMLGAAIGAGGAATAWYGFGGASWLTGVAGDCF